MSVQTVARVGRRIPERVRRAQDYRLYLETRYDAAETACRGVLLNADGERRGVNPRTAWFNGRQGTTRYASEELADWFAENGPTLTVREWRLQTGADQGAEDVEWDVVLDQSGGRHAVDYREWCDVAYTMCELWIDPVTSGPLDASRVCGHCGDLLPDAPEPVAAPLVAVVDAVETVGQADDAEAATVALVDGYRVVGLDTDHPGCDVCKRAHRKGAVRLVTGHGEMMTGLACAAELLGVEASAVRFMAREAMTGAA